MPEDATAPSVSLTWSFRRSADILPVCIVAAVFCVDVWAYRTLSTGMCMLYCAVMILPKGAICAWNHHHQHVFTFGSVFLNRLLEFAYTTQTGITTNVWVLHHVVGHHRHYLDQTIDESCWMRSDGTRMNSIEYGLEVAATGYYRACVVAKQFPKLAAPVIYMSVVALIWIAMCAYYNWTNALLLYVLQPSISLYVTAWHTFYQHSGLDSNNPLEASYNILDPLYNIITLNLGYHTAHHLKGSVHWSDLPALHEQISNGIPLHLYRRPPLPLRWMSAPLPKTLQKERQQVFETGPHRWMHLSDIVRALQPVETESK